MAQPATGSIKKQVERNAGLGPALGPMTNTVAPSDAALPCPPSEELPPLDEKLICRIADAVASKWRIRRQRDDVRQEAALAVIKQLRKRPESNPAYLYTVAWHAAVDWADREIRHEGVENPYDLDTLEFQRWQFDDLFEAPATRSREAEPDDEDVMVLGTGYAEIGGETFAVRRRAP
jgi:hypothetical protein